MTWASDVARMLAELGFAPRKVSANGSLRPDGEDGGARSRPPDLALILSDPDSTRAWKATRKTLAIGGRTSATPSS
jgi:hypothetical protein